MKPSRIFVFSLGRHSERSSPCAVRGLLRLASLAVCLLAAGCGRASGSKIVKAGGTVTRHGQPLPNVNVTFHPESGRPANGTTDASGRFLMTTLRNNDGAVVGRHKVSISIAGAPPMPGTAEAKNAGKTVPSFPARFSNPLTSGLKATVVAGSSNDFTFDLPD